MNVNRLHAAAVPTIHRVVKDAEEKEADFLALRLLNKKARVRLSPSPLKLDALSGKGALFAIASETGCFAAATCDNDGRHSIIVAGLAELRSAFATSESDSEIPFSPRCTITLPAQPNLLCFASKDLRLVVSFISGSLAIYDASAAATSGLTSPQPLHVFSSPTGRPARELSSNPGDMPDLVAVLYEPGSPDSVVVELLDAQKLQTIGGWQSGVSPSTIPTSVCWSPKGKQVAVGLQSGDIITFSPNDTSNVKTMVPRPTSHQLPSLISTSWLSNSDFLCTHAPVGLLIPDSEQAHVLVSLDSKSATVSETSLASPYLPFPGLRPPGSFLVVFRQWEPTKFLLFMGDSTSSDIGLIGCTEFNSQEVWQNFTLEETSTPTVPLDQEMNDTVLIGLSLDLTSTETYTHKTVSGEDSILPPPPVMYAYASDGTVVGWNVLNTLGKPYPGMKSGIPAPAPIQQIASVNMDSAEMDDKSEASTTQQAATPQTQATSTFGQPSSTPTYGQSGFGQTAFGNASPGTSTFANPSSTAFSAFASAGPSKFGQPSSLGTNSLARPLASPALASPMAVSTSNTSVVEDTMSTDTPTDTSFGGLSLGGSSAGEPDKSTSKGTTGTFGAFAPTPPPAQSSNTPAFGSTSAFGSVLKPATGFGAFGGQTTSSFGFGSASSSAGSPSSTSNTPSTPSPAFGNSSFGAANTATPAFGQSAFGQSSFGSKSALGQSGFGQSSSSTFGTPSTPTPAFGSGGGFAAFAQGGTTAFGSAVKASSELKPAEPTTPKGENKPDVPNEEKRVESTAPSTSPFGTPSTPAGKSTSAFGSPSPFSTAASTSATPTKTPPLAGGAFGNLTTSPAGFGKLDSGFGAFGSSTPSSSPFFNPPKNTGSNAFGSSVSAAPSAPGTPTPSAKPTFGAPSAFGKPAGNPTTPDTKSPFGSPSSFGTPSPFGQSAFANLGNSVASTRGFSNFSGGAGFGAFASGGQKSFSDLLRSQTDEKGKTPAPQKAPVSVFSNPPPTKSEDKGEGSSSTLQPKRTSVFAVPLDKKSEAKDVADAGPPSSEDGEHSEEGEEDENPEDEDDTGSFISETFSDEELPADELPEEHEEEDEEDEGALLEAELAAELANMPTMPMPTIYLTDPSPPESPEKKAPTVVADSTTPPGSPDKQPSVAAPTPVTAASPSAFGFGAGRPSTKPTRSSPLANAPISSRDSEDDTTEKLPQPKAPTPANDPKLRTSKIPIPGASTEGKTAVASRPKTPPALSLFGSGLPVPKPSPFTLAPSAAPTPSVFSMPPAASSSSKLSNLAAPATSQRAPSVFSPPSASTPSAKQLETPSSTEPNRATTPLFSQGGLFGQKSTTPPINAVGGNPASTPAPAALAFPPTPVGPLFGKKAATSTASPTTPPASGPGSLPMGGLFAQKPATPPPASAAGTLPPGSLFGQKAATPPPATPGAFTSGGSFEQKQSPTFAATPPATGGSSFGNSSAFPPPPATTPPAKTPTMDAANRSTDRIDPFAQLADGMQKECLNLILSVAREFEILRREAETIARKREENYQPKNVVRTAKDIWDPSQFGVADVQEFSALLKTLENDIGDLKQLRAGYSKALRELETAMLKATMRKEEIVRFSKANSDAEFAKMLKTRTLGPEHLETQTQLRRGIRLLRDRVQKLEDHLESSKKRINQLNTGKAGLRPPSLDTINRTYRNIGIAVAQQADDVSRIAARLSNLDLKSVQPDRSAIDFKSSPSKRNPDDAPNVAATTAAALNAERAAQKLKSALLRARKQPLLNQQAAAAPAPPSDFVSARKANQAQDTPTQEFNLSSLSWNSGHPSTPGQPHTPRWGKALSQSSDGSSSPSPSHGHGPRGKHLKPVPLKKSPGPAAPSTSTTPPGFSWGPLPGVTPMKTLSPDVRKKEEGSKLPFSLSSSWVTDDFDTKK
ncbi:hypothetical protein PHLGIDRAFT_125171 [Phlebiopsis gigantea 11061_1 CR5-6]|uniref:Nucleoporin Nup159/Nup146 N-terminal domain-containing protein n=1 Tax=Phlebiopsis gigantea (strain 11061_1 CR5-6) TaxID=745531 RepID=A0A0C3PTX4_PHLG1|nr:hypothetical protein PHLGIDRAFT_125171 [Phlebiopsis gigantea 11061_1 CR5-6]